MHFHGRPVADPLMHFHGLGHSLLGTPARAGEVLAAVALAAAAGVTIRWRASRAARR